MEEKDAEAPNTRHIISRRRFFKIAGTTVAVAAAGYAARRLGLKPDNLKTTHSPEIELRPSVKVLDFFDIEKAKAKYLQDNFPNGFSEEKSCLEMGVSDPSTREGLLRAVPRDENQAKLLMMLLFQYQYQNHGKDVISVMEKTASYLNPAQIVTTPEHDSIASAVEFGKLEYDEIGNPTIHVRLSPEIVDELISHSAENVVNMSFELGEFSLAYSLYDKKLKYPEMARQGPSKITVGEETTYRDYQGNDITEKEYNEIAQKMAETETVTLEPNERDVKFLDGYAGGKTYQNLLKLTDVARKHSGKMFIAAGGNPTYLQGLKIPDIREARAALEKQGQWPSNLLIVGFQAIESGFVGPASYGADIYVSAKDLEELGFSGASSYATPVVTEITRRLIANGANTHKQIMEGLRQLTQAAESWEGSEKVEYRLLNLDKAKNSLANLKLE
jgi:hypothetical protein